MATKQKVPTGAQVIFSGYAEDDAKGPLLGHDGVSLKVTGYDKDDDTYNVECEIDGETVEDALFDDEFSAEKAKAATKKDATKKAAAKKAAAKKVASKKTKAPTLTVVEDEEVKEVKDLVAKKTAKKVAKKVAKAKVKEEAPLPAFKRTTTLTSTLKEYEGDACAAAYDWCEEVERSNFVLGGLLAYIKRNDEHAKILSEELNEDGTEYLPAYKSGLKGFSSFVEDYLGLKAVKAHWLVRIYETFSQIATEKQIAAVGWTKLRELLPLGDILTVDNVQEWLDKASEETTADLHESVKKKLVKSGAKTHGNKGKDEQTTRKFVFFNHQAEVIEEAIERKKAEMDDTTKGDYPDSAALYAIISEWSDLQEQEG
jgi:hypothetical protein